LTNRIVAVETGVSMLSPAGPAAFESSIARMTLRAITLPFARPKHSLIAGAPLILLLGFFWIDAAFFIAGPLSIATPSVPALQEIGREQGNMWMRPSGGLFWVAGWIALAFWCVAWQRAVLRGFNEPVLRWLLDSLRWLPICLPLFLVWYFLVVALMGLSNAIYTAELHLEISPNGLPLRPGGLIGNFGPLVVGFLVALWFLVQVSPLLALSAEESWQANLAATLRLTHGRLGLRMYLAFLGIILLSWILGVQSRHALALFLTDATLFGYIWDATRLVALLTQIWLVTLPALVVASIIGKAAR
jgi:hypothetical protein